MMQPKAKHARPQNTSSVKQLSKNAAKVQPATKAVSPPVPFCDTLYPQAWEFQVEKCLTSIDKRMQILSRATKGKKQSPTERKCYQELLKENSNPRLKGNRKGINSRRQGILYTYT